MKREKNLRKIVFLNDLSSHIVGMFANVTKTAWFRMIMFCYDKRELAAWVRRPPCFNDKKIRTEGRRKCHRRRKKTTKENIWCDRLPPRGEEVRRQGVRTLIKIKS